jgi:hypothetical protein
MTQFIDERTGISYTRQGDYFLPDLILPKQEHFSLGRYAMLCKTYLKSHRRVLYTNLLTSCKLNEHLHEVDVRATEMVKQIVKAMAEADGTDEHLKATDQMRWVGLMNNYRHCAEEIVFRDVVYE